MEYTIKTFTPDLSDESFRKSVKEATEHIPFTDWENDYDEKEDAARVAFDEVFIAHRRDITPEMLADIESTKEAWRTWQKGKAHEEWLAERSKGVGSSEVSALFGCNPYSTPLSIYLRKKGLSDEPQDQDGINIPAERGHRLEPMVADLFERKTGVYVAKDSEGDWIAISNEKPYMRVSPDRLIVEDGGGVGILECKTTLKQIDKDDVPDMWFLQLQYQLHVMGLKYGYLAWYCGRNDDFKYQRFEYSETTGKAIEDKITDFWNNHILASVPPEPSTVREMNAVWKQSEDSEVTADQEVQFAIARLKEIRDQQKELEKQTEVYEQIVKEAMREHERLVSPEGMTLATWKTAKASQRFDSAAFKKDHADIYSKYTIETPGARRFLVK